MKKITNILIVLIIILNTFLPFIKVDAAVTYDLYISYYDNDVLIKSYENYDEAITAMKETESNETAVAIVKQGNKVINANYAFVQTNTWQINNNDYEDNLNLFQDPSLAYSNANAYTYVNGGWGVDAAFIDYNLTYQMVKLKISGFTGYARLSSISIVPISKFFIPRLYSNTAIGTNVRSEANTTSNIVTTIFPGVEYVYSPSKTITVDNYKWYYIDTVNVKGWVREDLVEIKSVNNIQTYYYAYNTGSGSNKVKELYHKYRTAINGVSGNSNFVIGKAPNEIEASVSETIKYYSFDSNYFYTDIFRLLDDYKNNIYENAINEKPYFSYYLYIPGHSKSGYTAETFDMIITKLGYTSQPSSDKVYAANCTYTTSSSERAGISKLYGMGSTFIEMQNTYGINSLLAFGKAMSESGEGRSVIALQKNNLFGIGASDKNPCTNATTYESPQASIMAYGTIGNAYANPLDSRFAGSHYGNKGSGMNVKYASDPYWGEKAAMHAYLYDSRYGRLDYDYNTIGIKESSTVVPILKQPGGETTTNVIYYTKNYPKASYKIINMPFIVLDKVNYNGISYYKIQTDPALDENQKIISGNYTFENSYGYIEAKYLTVNNNQPTLEAANKTVKQGEEIDLLENVVATDIEDGNITENITYDDSLVNYYVPGEYDLTYSVKDNNNFNKSITVKLTVTEGDKPIITGEDISVTALKEFDILKDLKIYNDNNLDKVNYKIVINNIEKTLEEMLKNPGVYEVTYQAVDKFNNKSNEFTRNVTVVQNELPMISAKDITVKQNSEIDLLKDVVATDKEDGNLIEYVTYETNLDISTPGSYSLTYKVSDFDKQEVTKTITITVEEMDYTLKEGYLHLESLKYSSNTNTLNIYGFLNVNDIKITKESNIFYDLVLENQLTKETTIIKLDRKLDNIPFEALNNNKSWFYKEIDLKDIKQGDYTIYVRGRIGSYETKKILKNIFFIDDITTRFINNNRGFYIRTDYTTNEMPLELFVRDAGLITDYQTSILYNIYNQYYNINFDNSKLTLKGTSHSYKGNYSKDSLVEREIIFENVETFERKNYELGSITNGDYKVSLAISDGFDKTKAWYNNTIDISNLNPGRYAIIIRTKTKEIDDFGELYDCMWSNINFSTTYVKDGKTYNAKIIRNNDIRMRLELIIEEA